MLGAVIVFCAGVIVGWAFPQPQWVSDLWSKIKAKISS